MLILLVFLSGLKLLSQGVYPLPNGRSWGVEMGPIDGIFYALIFDGNVGIKSSGYAGSSILQPTS